MLDQVLADLRGDGRFMRGVHHWQVIPGRAARYVSFPPAVDVRIRAAYERRGITRLYTHQARCYELARAGRNVVLVTPTASGKTLAYNLPVLHTLLEQPDATALYLFPTKALAQDQQHELGQVVLGGGGGGGGGGDGGDGGGGGRGGGRDLSLPVFTFDGDTPGAIRATVRDKGRLVITNPDMLHGGMLPNHPKWNRFFRSLRYVVIDELHTYRGIFGSHLTNVLRRLRRVAAFYGVQPQFICCSATIGNPLQLAQRVLEQPAELIDDNGAPAGERHFVLYNPPLVDAAQGIRRGVVVEAQAIAARLLLQGVKTIVFARSRVRTELIASYIRDALRRRYDDGLSVPGPSRGRLEVASYRGGYLPGERRAIERGLRDDRIAGVVATTALELGIDIGGLDASILAGFPGTIASSWQQAGRAGRRTDTALSILIASASPIDQFIIRHPEYFFERSPEHGWVDPDNIFVLLDQLKCAVFELPFADAEWEGPAEPAFQREVGALLEHLEQGGVVRHTAAKWFWSDRSYPAENVSLRTSTAANIVIIDQTRGRRQVIGEMDLPSAKMLLFDGAIYLHRGAQFTVTRLELDHRRCLVEETDVNYFTDAIVKTDLKILHRDVEEEHAALRLLLGDILVRRQATKFKKLRFRTHENIGYGDISLPAEEIHTRALALYFPPDCAGGAYLAARGEAERALIVDRVGVLLRNVAPVFLLCDPRDLGVVGRLRDDVLDCPAVYVYDTYPGGSGLAEGLHHALPEVLAGCRDLVAGCGCSNGCPSCIGPPEEQGALTRQAVLAALDHLLPTRAEGAQVPPPAGAAPAVDPGAAAGDGVPATAGVARAGEPAPEPATAGGDHEPATAGDGPRPAAAAAEVFAAPDSAVGASRVPATPAEAAEPVPPSARTAADWVASAGVARAAELEREPATAGGDHEPSTAGDGPRPAAAAAAAVSLAPDSAAGASVVSGTPAAAAEQVPPSARAAGAAPSGAGAPVAAAETAATAVCG